MKHHVAHAAAALCLGTLWTFASLLWLFSSDYTYSLHSPGEWLRVVLVLPGLVGVLAAERLYRIGVWDVPGVVVGVLVGSVLTLLSLSVVRRGGRLSERLAWKR